jgi:hypothetical protein
MSLDIFYKIVTEGLLANVIRKIQAEGHTIRPASRLVGREQFMYRIPVTRARLEGKSQCMCVQRERSTRLGKL